MKISIITICSGGAVASLQPIPSAHRALAVFGRAKYFFEPSGPSSPLVVPRDEEKGQIVRSMDRL
jgi:hypothetical protein